MVWLNGCSIAVLSVKVAVNKDLMSQQVPSLGAGGFGRVYAHDRASLHKRPMTLAMVLSTQAPDHTAFSNAKLQDIRGQIKRGPGTKTSKQNAATWCLAVPAVMQQKWASLCQETGLDQQQERHLRPLLVATHGAWSSGSAGCTDPDSNSDPHPRHQYRLLQQRRSLWRGTPRLWY